MQPSNKFHSIKNWADQDKPREKMLLKGKNVLSDAELLAILINTGTAQKNALDIAREILSAVRHNLHELGNLEIKDLQKFKGMGEAKAITICAALELGRRRLNFAQEERPILNTPKTLYQIVRPVLENNITESFYALYLNNKLELIRLQAISIGSLDHVLVDVRVIYKHALNYNATAIAVAHNHPSGQLKASEADIKTTRKIIEAGKLFDIRFIDHIIVAGHNFLSMSEEGLF